MKNPLPSFAPVAPVKEEKIHQSKTHLHPNKQYHKKKEKTESLVTLKNNHCEKKIKHSKTSGWSKNLRIFKACIIFYRNYHAIEPRGRERERARYTPWYATIWKAIFLFDVYEDHSIPEKGLKNPKKTHTIFFFIESGVWNEYPQSDDIFWHFWLDVCSYKGFI